MVSYFKEAESNPAVLDKYLIYESDLDNLIRKDPLKSASGLNINGSYKVIDLINKTIIESDNGAEHLLLNNISQTSLDSIYNALNIENPDETNHFTISPRTYSLFLRILYSATYLNSINSEKALDILSKTTFADGLAAGVPAGVAIAHKYGEYALAQNNIIRQIELHDCGIIYYPKNPYLLCVMTKGNNLDNLKRTIKNISSLVYSNYSGLK
jgi:beta-lactamase class A